MYEFLKTYSLRRSSVLIRIGIIMLIANTILAIIFPLNSFPINVDSSGNDFSTFQNLPSYLLTAGKMMSNLIGFVSLISGIGVYIQDKRKGTVSYFSVKNGPVDIEKQIQFVFVPGLDVYAAYKVKKLTKYFLILLGIGIPILILVLSITGISYYLLLVEGAVLPVAIYHIRKWSKKWNEQISENISNKESKDDVSSRTALG